MKRVSFKMHATLLSFLLAVGCLPSPAYADSAEEGTMPDDPRVSECGSDASGEGEDAPDDDGGDRLSVEAAELPASDEPEAFEELGDLVEFDYPPSSGERFDVEIAPAPAEGPLGDGGPAAEPGLAPEGWVEEGGERYYYEGGGRLSGELLDGGSWYYLDPERGGAMASSEFVLLEDPGVQGGLKWVYYGPDGRMLYGERLIDGGWYYLAPGSGAVSYGFVLLEDPGVQGGLKWVWYGESMGDGRMRYGEHLIDGGWYYLAPGSGAVSYGFVLLDDPSAEGGRKWVWYGPHMGDGRMRYGEQFVDGGWYYLTPGNGAVDYEWALIPDGLGGSKWVYYGPYMGDGRMRYGTQRVDGKLYYFDEHTGEVYSTDDIIDRVLDVARSQIGTPDSLTWSYQFAVSDAGGNYCYQGPCCSFVWWCFDQAGMREFFCDGMITGWPHECYDWYKSRGRVDWNPTPGSIVFWQYGGWSAGLSCGHAGFVIDSGPGYVRVLDVVTGGVQVRVYSYSGIVGFAHPY